MSSFLESVLSNIIANIIAAAILIFLGFISFRKSKAFFRALRFMRRMRRNGFIGFFNSRSEYAWARRQKTLEDYILLTQKDFCYVGIYLYSGTEAGKLDAAFSTLLERGAQIKLVLLDPDLSSELVGVLENHLGMASATLAARLKHACDHFQGYRSKLSVENQTGFKICTHKTVIFSSAMFIDWREKDGRMLVDTKISGAGRDRSFGMEFRKVSSGSKLSNVLADSFDHISKTAETIR